MAWVVARRSLDPGAERFADIQLQCRETVQDAGIETPAYRLVICERSPYQKVVSLANWMLHPKRCNRAEPAEITEAVVKAQLAEIIENGEMPRVYNIDRYRDRTGVVAPFTLLRTSDLQRDFDVFLQEIGAKPMMLPWAKKTGSGVEDIRSILTRPQLDLINAVFQSEFETFGFARV